MGVRKETETHKPKLHPRASIEMILGPTPKKVTKIVVDKYGFVVEAK
jgi:hypothetical protein